MEKIIIIEVSDNKSVYIKASSIEAIEVNKVEVNELKYVICITMNSGKQFSSKIYDSCIDAQNKVDELLQSIFCDALKDDNVYVLD